MSHNSPSASWVRANLSPAKNLKHDLPAGLVVFLVALPLCLGIALASGAPLFAGVITGIVGGLVVSWLSGSPLSVSGPAAGLAVVVMTAVGELGWEAFLLAVVISGIFQYFLGVARAGLIAYYFPSSVIKGLLAAIGVILILKQIPHAIGYDGDYEGDMAFSQLDGRNTLTEIPYALGHFHIGAVVIAIVSLAILIGVARSPRLANFKWLPAPLAAVAAGVILNGIFTMVAPGLANHDGLLVNMPAIGEAGLLSVLRFPDFGRIADPAIYRTAGTIAVVASIETLLCVEAIDRLDPFSRRSNTNKELKAQGIGNFLTGLVGGLPMTAVIVRGSANVHSGGRTPMSSFAHGVLLFGSVLLVPGLLNMIPLAALAAVLLHIGYKLAPVSLFRRIWGQGKEQFLPFIITVLAILFTDLLVGVCIGLAAGTFYILRAHLSTPYFMHSREAHEEDHAEGRRQHIHIELSENVSFLNKASVNKALHEIADGSVVEIDGSHARHIDRDVLEIIHEFADGAAHRGIDVSLFDIPSVDSPASALMKRKPVEVRGNVVVKPARLRKMVADA